MNGSGEDGTRQDREETGTKATGYKHPADGDGTGEDGDKYPAVKSKL